MKIKGIFFVTAFTFALGIGAATKAMAVVPNCSVVTPVTESCGWVITTPGCYKLQNNLTATTDAGDCVQINSSNVFLDLNTQTITGTGATSIGAGVHVLAETTPGAVAISNVAVQGGNISGFFFGVMVGDVTGTINVGPFVTKVRLDNMMAENNNDLGFYLYNAKLSQLSGLNSTSISQAGLDIFGGSGNHVSNSSFIGNSTGVVVAQSSGNVLSAVNASFSGDFGFYLIQATGNQIDSPSADSNASSGVILLKAAKSNVILGGQANSNGVYGIWVEQSQANQVSGIELRSNGSAGIYLGCDGPTTGTCTAGIPGIPMSNANGIDANINITGSPYGMAIDKGNLNNTIVGNTSSGNATLDEYDGNKCGVNNWFADNFGTSNASCVH
jgi:parallel beta helix pectate lyase-like protein